MRDCLYRSDRSSGSALLRHGQAFLSRGEHDRSRRSLWRPRHRGRRRTRMPSHGRHRKTWPAVDPDVYRFHRNDRTYYEIVCQTRSLNECGLPLGSPNRPRRPRRRLVIGADCEDGQRIREGSKQRKIRSYHRETAEDEGRRRGRLEEASIPLGGFVLCSAWCIPNRSRCQWSVVGGEAVSSFRAWGADLRLIVEKWKLLDPTSGAGTNQHLLVISRPRQN
jgi:hypothetical protein